MFKSLVDILAEDKYSNIKETLSNIYIQKINVNKENNSWDIILNCSLPIAEIHIDIIKHELQQKFGITGLINIIIEEFCYRKMTLEDINQDNSKLALIIDEAFSKKPSINCLLQASKFSIEMNKIIFYIDNEFFLSLIKEKSVKNIFKKHLKDYYNIEAEIEFEKYLTDVEGYNNLKNELDRKLVYECVNSTTQTQTKVKTNNYIAEKVLRVENINTNLIFGKKIVGAAESILSINEQSGIVIISGEIFKTELKETKNGKFIFSFYITDYTSSITIKFFPKSDIIEDIKAKIKEGTFVRVRGEAVNDKFMRELVIMALAIESYIPERRVDKSVEKRVELHLHTQMSAMDGISSTSDLIKRAKEWGHSAIAITDHGVVQAFPEAMEASKKHGIKVIYGVEGYLVDDGEPLVIFAQHQPLNGEFVIFDIETTGLSNNTDKITEIGAVKIKDHKIIDRFSALVNPERPIPAKIVELTSITDEMVKNEPTIEEVLPRFLEFVGNLPVVAHNAKFDTGFIRAKAKHIGKNFLNTIIDTLPISKWLLPDLKRHKLNNIAEYLDVNLKNHHRAVDDAEATAMIFLKFLKILTNDNYGAKDLNDINKLYGGNFDIKKANTNHVIILVKNLDGLYNLYKLISMSNLNYFHKRPRLPKSLIEQYRDGLIIGSACEAGEIYRGFLDNLQEDEINRLVNFYDYLEIQPRGNNEFLIAKGMIENEEKLLEINKKIYDLGKKYNKPVVATGDVHFLDPKDEYYRRILMAGKGFSDADKQAPLYFKTTDEMLEEFSYLGYQNAIDAVITSPNKISNMVESIKPIPDGTYTPKIEGAEEEVKNMTLNKARSIYGDILPEIVEKRLEKELNSIINHGYAVLYLIAHKLVKKSMEDGYLVGSRGSVGSSFVATMCDITEVNPLPPHYVCPNCKNSEFFNDGIIFSGADLSDKECPLCGSVYIKDGHDIPFEVFLGFEGDKEPDIDLNFSGEYQAIAHKYTEELFGEGHTFKAGTIGTIAEKTAFGYVKNYLEERNINITQAEIHRLVKGCTGVKRTSGQHPGGIMVLPKDKSIYEFTPIQRPADDVNSDIITTHFDYHSISGRLLKLDILGHDDPTVIRMLQDLTKLDPTKIPLGDERVIRLFTSTEPLGVTKEDINSEVGTFGLPVFGTKFVRQMLIDTQPKTFAELVRISGLSHGTDVWLNNAQELIKSGYATLKEVISTRDDIMVYLMYSGLKPKEAFTIMEKVRKGKTLNDEEISLMKDHKVPQWYIDSCRKIKYMFPKGHAVAYVMMAVRIAYFKLYYPKEYYATYFTVRADDFDGDLIVKGEAVIQSKIKELEALGNNVTQKDKGLLTTLEIAFEMNKRGIFLKPVDLYKSDAVIFSIDEDKILPPLKALDGVGENAAKAIVKAREESPFLSKEDLRLRSKVSKTVIETLDNHGCLTGLPENNQLSLF
jgi:DNA polymerase III subunit alpha, Gram-positive type